MCLALHLPCICRVDYTHPDLKNNMWVNPGEIPGNGIDDDGNGYIDGELICVTNINPILLPSTVVVNEPSAKGPTVDLLMCPHLLDSISC